MQIITANKFPFGWLRKMKCQERERGNPGGKQKGKCYKDIITAFDIETTRLPEIEQSIMYVWQWCFGDKYTVLGRTWDDFLLFCETLNMALGKKHLCIYVHNLSFEFQFLRGVWDFEEKDVFAIKPRKILKAQHAQLEFRCSYIHSNMSLAEYLKKYNVKHQKLSGQEYDYTKARYPWTELTEREQEYCCNDVIGLVEALTAEMDHDGDTLYTVPLTSTGYVRRDIKKAVRDAEERGDISYSYVRAQYPDIELYRIFREAFRGGDTHANRYFVGQIVENGHSADRSSSYPDVVCNCQFPVSEFYTVKGRMNYADMLKLILVRKKAVIMRCAITGLRLIDEYYPAPYLSKDKCRNVKTSATDWIDNGRILQADYLETTITDIDLQIILHEYTWTDIVFYDVSYARYGMLPQAIIDETIKYYHAKTELKGVHGQEIYYMKSKNKINAIYGMFAQDPCKHSINYTQNGVIDKYGAVDLYPEDASETDKDILDKNSRRAFVCYQWGVWVTAWARLRLREAIWEVIRQQAEFLYCDTDSVKYLGVVDWTSYNRERIKDSKRSGSYASDAAGIVHYMGVMEQEADFTKFATLGAKKYVYVDEHSKLHVTIAGVGKSAGARELEAAGGIKAFKTGFCFTGEAGGLEAIYNDFPTVNSYKADGHTIVITSNVCLRPSTYTLGVSAEFERLLKNRQYTIDI